MDLFLFYFFGIGLIATSLAAIFFKHPIHSILSIITSFFFLAAIYLTFSMQFLATIQILAYAGAIMVLFLFIIMLFDIKKSEYSKDKFKLLDYFTMIFLTVAMVLSIHSVITSKSVSLYDRSVDVGSNFGSISVVASSLFGDGTTITKYTFIFEIISLVLLVAIIGSVVIAKKRL